MSAKDKCCKKFKKKGDCCKGCPYKESLSKKELKAILKKFG